MVESSESMIVAPRRDISWHLRYSATVSAGVFELMQEYYHCSDHIPPHLCLLASVFFGSSLSVLSSVLGVPQALSAFCSSGALDPSLAVSQSTQYQYEQWVRQDSVPVPEEDLIGWE